MKKWNRGNKRAFTLAEMLIVVAIIGVIVAIAILQLANARKNLQVKANDSNAKLIYLAAQNQMLQMKEYGQWGALLANERVVSNGESELKLDYFGYSLAAPGHAASNITEVDEMKGGTEQKPSDYSWFYQREGAAGAPDWDTVKEDMRVVEHTSAVESGLVQTILPLGTVEDDVRTMGKYIIEYDVRTASVYGVFYTESDGALDYTSEGFVGKFYGDGLEQNGRPTAANVQNETDARRIRRDYNDINGEETILGYFGGSMAYGLDYTPLELPAVRIDNGEELILQIKDPNSTNTADGRQTTMVQFTVKGKTSGNAVTYQITQPAGHNGTASGGYTVQQLSGNNLLTPKKMVKTCTEAADGISYEIVLDSITPGEDGENLHFANNFCTFSGGSLPTSSIIPGEDIEVTVLVKPKVASDNNRVALPVSRTVETNSLYTKTTISSPYFITEVTIDQMRHLQNLSKQISGASFGGKSGGNLTVDFGHSVSFDGTGDGLLPIVPKDYSSKGTFITRYNGGKTNYSGEYPSFVPIEFGAIINLTVNGNGCMVYNVVINKTGKAIVDSETTKTSLTMPLEGISIGGGQIGVINPIVPVKTTAIGLFGTVNGSVNITALGIVSSETTDGKDSAPVKTVYAGNANAIGAFVGYVGGSASLKGCWSTVQIQSDNAPKDACIGGLLGNVAGKAMIDRCYVSGNTVKGVYRASATKANIYVNANGKIVNAGGMVGNCGNAEITDSYCVADIGLVTSDNATADVYYNIGGLAGNVAGSIKIRNSYFGGWMNVPLRLEPRLDTVNYGGFVGKIGGSGKRVDADLKSFWIREYLGISNLPENPQNYAIFNINIYGRFLRFVWQDGDTRAFPYDSAWYQESYPFEDVTGLGHHWGDWCTTIPEIGLYVVNGLGITKIDPAENLPAGLRDHEVYNDTGVKFKSVPAEIVCDLEEILSLTHDEGYAGAWYRENGNIDIEPYDPDNPGDLPEGLEKDHHYFVTQGKTALIYVTAEEVVTPEIEPGSIEIGGGTGGNISDVFNHQDHYVNVSQGITYDDDVTLRKFIAYAPSQAVLDGLEVQKTKTGMRVKSAGESTFHDYASNDSYIMEDISDVDSYLIEKDNHYGTMYYKVYAFAYSEDGHDTLFSNVITPEFNVNLYRVEMVFHYATNYYPGTHWSLSGGNSNVTRYVEYDSSTIYSAGSGSTYIQSGQIINTPGSGTTPPSVTLDQYYDNAFDLIGWALPKSGVTPAEPDPNHVIYQASGNGYNTSHVWYETSTINLYPYWGNRPMKVGIDPNGGYWETIQASTPSNPAP